MEPEPDTTRPKSPPDPTALALVLCLAVALAALALGGPPQARDSGATAAAALVQPGRTHALLTELQKRHPGRYPGRPAWRDGIAFIASSLQQAGASDVRIQRLTGNLREVINVTARVPGRDDSYAVVLAAHHDVVAGAPGAIDDGGACAVIIEAVRVLADGPPPACDVVLAIFDGEEQGLLGSKAYVEDLGETGLARVRAAIAVELVGWTQDQLVVHTIPSGFAWEAEGVPPAWLPATIRAAATDVGETVGFGDPVLWPWYQGTVRLFSLKTGSDAGAFLEAGVPAVMLTGSALTNFYDAYHTPNDTMANVDSARLDAAARVVVASARALAALTPEQTPRNLGEPYLALGSRTLGRWSLLLLGLSAAAATGFAAAQLARSGRRMAALLVYVVAVSLAGCALIGAVAALTVGIPLATGLATAVRWPRYKRVFLYPGLAVLAIQIVVMGAICASFGFDTRGSWLEWGLTVTVSASALAATVTVGRVRPAPSIREAPEVPMTEPGSEDH